MLSLFRRKRAGGESLNSGTGAGGCAVAEDIPVCTTLPEESAAARPKWSRNNGRLTDAHINYVVLGECVGQMTFSPHFMLCNGASLMHLKCFLDSRHLIQEAPANRVSSWCSAVSRATCWHVSVSTGPSQSHSKATLQATPAVKWLCCGCQSTWCYCSRALLMQQPAATHTSQC
jgi:hypothetical protein